MRSRLLTIPATSSTPLRLSPPSVVDADPHHTWLKMLAGGASLGAVAMIVAAIWNCVQLASRLRSSVPFQFLLNYRSAIMLAIIACSWIAAMALTSEDPSTDALRIRPFGKLLRWIVTAAFLFISCWSLRLLNELPKSWLREWVLPAMQVAAVLTSALLMIQTVALSRRLGYRSLTWRAALTALGLLVTAGLQYLPMIFPELGRRQSPLGFHFQNLQGAMNALWATIAALVYVRVLVSVANEWRNDPSPRS